MQGQQQNDTNANDAFREKIDQLHSLSKTGYLVKDYINVQKALFAEIGQTPDYPQSVKDKLADAEFIEAAVSEGLNIATEAIKTILNFKLTDLKKYAQVFKKTLKLAKKKQIGSQLALMSHQQSSLSTPTTKNLHELIQKIAILDSFQKVCLVRLAAYFSAHRDKKRLIDSILPPEYLKIFPIYFIKALTTTAVDYQTSKSVAEEHSEILLKFLLFKNCWEDQKLNILRILQTKDTIDKDFFTKSGSFLAEALRKCQNNYLSKKSLLNIYFEFWSRLSLSDLPGTLSPFLQVLLDLGIRSIKVKTHTINRIGHACKIDGIKNWSAKKREIVGKDVLRFFSSQGNVRFVQKSMLRVNCIEMILKLVMSVFGEERGREEQAKIFRKVFKSDKFFGDVIAGLHQGRCMWILNYLLENESAIFKYLETESLLERRLKLLRVLLSLDSFKNDRYLRTQSPWISKRQELYFRLIHSQQSKFPESAPKNTPKVNPAGLEEFNPFQEAEEILSTKPQQYKYMRAFPTRNHLVLHLAPGKEYSLGKPEQFFVDSVYYYARNTTYSFESLEAKGSENDDKMGNLADFGMKESKEVEYRITLSRIVKDRVDLHRRLCPGFLGTVDENSFTSLECMSVGRSIGFRVHRIINFKIDDLKIKGIAPLGSKNKCVFVRVEKAKVKAEASWRQSTHQKKKLGKISLYNSRMKKTMVSLTNHFIQDPILSTIKDPNELSILKLPSISTQNHQSNKTPKMVYFANFGSREQPSITTFDFLTRKTDTVIHKYNFSPRVKNFLRSSVKQYKTLKINISDDTNIPIKILGLFNEFLFLTFSEDFLVLKIISEDWDFELAYFSQMVSSEIESVWKVSGSEKEFKLGLFLLTSADQKLFLLDLFSQEIRFYSVSKVKRLQSAAFVSREKGVVLLFDTFNGSRVMRLRLE